MAALKGWPCSRTLGGVAVLSRCGELPWVRASVDAAVRCRGKASGRRVVRRVSRGRVAPACCRCASSPAVAACAVTRRKARRAPRALEDVKKVLTDWTTSDWTTSVVEVLRRGVSSGQAAVAGRWRRQERGNMCLRFQLMLYTWASNLNLS
jgi:hypothetical protein